MAAISGRITQAGFNDSNIGLVLHFTSATKAFATCIGSVVSETDCCAYSCANATTSSEVRTTNMSFQVSYPPMQALMYLFGNLVNSISISNYSIVIISSPRGRILASERSSRMESGWSLLMWPSKSRFSAACSGPAWTGERILKRSESLLLKASWDCVEEHGPSPSSLSLAL